jgi:hypothetical protein
MSIYVSPYLHIPSQILERFWEMHRIYFCVCGGYKNLFYAAPRTLNLYCAETGDLNPQTKGLVARLLLQG